VAFVAVTPRRQRASVAILRRAKRKPGGRLGSPSFIFGAVAPRARGHDFYTGCERIFERIAPELNGGLTQGAACHRDLLRAMTLELPGVRPPVLTPAAARALGEYLRFRHLVRNGYGFELEWARLEPLLRGLPAVFTAVRADLERFLAFLDAATAV
jgi:hypothetical protein